MSNENENKNEETKVVEMKPKKEKPDNYILRMQIKCIFFCIAAVVICYFATSYVTEKRLISNPEKARINIETLPCGLPLERQYIDQLKGNT